MPGAKFYANKDWRAMLEVAEEIDLPKSKRRKQMLALLEGLIDSSQSSSITLDVKTTIRAPAFWNGAEVHLNALGQLDSRIVQEIIWELYEAKFRLELIALHHKMLPKPQGSGEQFELAQEIWYDRERLVYRCWPGQAHCPQYKRPGFSTITDYAQRIPFVKALHILFQTWPGPKPLELRTPFPGEDDRVALWAVEEALASYYIRVFLRCFQRPPTIPHVANPVVATAPSLA